MTIWEFQALVDGFNDFHSAGEEKDEPVITQEIYDDMLERFFK